MASFGRAIVVPVIALLVAACPRAWAVSLATGIGEPNDPYQVATPEQLVSIGSDPNLLDKHFVLTADIDLAAYVFDRAVVAPDACIEEHYFTGIPFSGSLDGQGHVIRNLRIDAPDVNYVGLFGWIKGGSIRDLQLEAVQITGGSYVGALAGGSEAGRVTSLRITGVVRGTRDVGGFIGANMGSVRYSRSSVELQGVNLGTGGIAGFNASGAGYIGNCSNTGRVIARDHVGGIVGDNQGYVINSLNSGAVEGETTTGGLVGVNEGGRIMNSCSDGPVTAHSSVGGLVGLSAFGGSVAGNGNIINCYSTGRVSGKSLLGGLVGDYREASRITDCFWDVETSGLAVSAGGTGLTTAAMQNLQTYVDAGWDMAGRAADGTSEVWRIPEEGGYPVLAISDEQPPSLLNGHGTPDDPYLIGNAYDLGGMLYGDLHACYRLTAFIDLSGITWSTAVVPWFNGVFDGNDRSILNLTIQGTSCLGLLGRMESGAELKNLAMVDVNVVGIGDCVGALVGLALGNVVNSCSSGAVCGRYEVGGLIGESYGSSSVHVFHCGSTAAVAGHGVVGGLIGGNTQTAVTGCCSTGAVTGAKWLIFLKDSRVVDDGPVGTPSAPGTSVYISDYNDQIGGLVGANWSAPVNDCYSTGAVTGAWFVGGLLGTYGDLGGGGLTSCYSGGRVTGETYVGGLVGQNPGWFGATTCFWDKETSGLTRGCMGTGMSTSAMHTGATFVNAGWDFVDTWTICEGTDYPRLKWENRPCPQGESLTR